MARRKKTSTPIIADSGAREKIETAAQAVGMTPQELADLIFESGSASLPSASDLKQTYSIEDLGKRLWADMQARPKSDRSHWFAGLTNTQKTAVICVLRDRGFRTEVIAKDFAIEPSDVMRTWNAYAGSLGTQVVGIRLDTIAGQLQLAAERAQQMAVESNDHRTYWMVQRELTEMYQSIGIVDKAIHRVEVSHKLDDQARAELDKLIELDRKKNKRMIEIEQITGVQLQSDDIPEEVRDDYDG